MLNRISAALSAAALAAALLAVPGAAAAATPAPTLIKLDPVLGDAARDYWTPERRAKVLAESELADRSSEAALTPEYPAIGKLFSSFADGFHISCTGFAIPARRHADGVFMTAAHCISLPQHGALQNVVFYPNYAYGNTRGEFVGTAIGVQGGFNPNNSFYNDIAIVQVRKSERGEKLNDAVGAMNLLFGGDRAGVPTRMIGYHGRDTSPDNASECRPGNSWTRDDWWLPIIVVLDNKICKFAHGSSGGPFISSGNFVYAVQHSISNDSTLITGGHLNASTGTLYDLVG